jgi:hypothetical protein
LDYEAWGGEYLELAARLREHIVPVRRALKTARGKEQVLLYRRAALLEEMRLECLRTGRSLVKRGGGKA